MFFLKVSKGYISKSDTFTRLVKEFDIHVFQFTEPEAMMMFQFNNVNEWHDE
jgi:hypothetical protein